ncbi:histidine phosphatase family protein [Nocardioides sp. SOB77]|uniref:Histidine phosphatase family protein n=1 Tax=Nocardioides oceani TaxID=3058369 RepID=A0ABT8FEZ8_9ACTN|nr:histidine phosphatase family protein [Nocardioides oceani]MDN4173254.1 histidine phosphatase family protein [Nocardioides oceani]
MGVLLLVRHGQASFGADDYDVLSATGHEQARLLGKHLAGHGVTPDVVVRGDMRRHRETAEGMLAGGGWSADVEVDAGWDEFDHLGVVAAHPDLASPSLDRREFQRVFEEATARWTSGAGDATYPEPWPGFLGRVRGSLERACAQAGPGGTVVVVTSGGPVAVAAATLVDPDGDPATTARLWGRFNTVVVNSSYSRVVVGSTGARLLTFNEHAHLEGDTLTYR